MSHENNKTETTSQVETTTTTATTMQEEKPLDKQSPLSTFFDKYWTAYLIVFFVIISNIGSVYLYDKFFAPKINIVDMQELLYDPIATKKLSNQEITENEFTIALKKRVEAIEQSLLTHKSENINSIYLVKGAVVDIEKFKNKSYKDITDEIKTSISNSTQK